ncbi:unnamed protein product, partial [Didymodactylos carnosus]
MISEERSLPLKIKEKNILTPVNNIARRVVNRSKDSLTVKSKSLLVPTRLALKRNHGDFKIPPLSCIPVIFEGLQMELGNSNRDNGLSATEYQHEENQSLKYQQIMSKTETSNYESDIHEHSNSNYNALVDIQHNKSLVTPCLRQTQVVSLLF